MNPQDIKVGSLYFGRISNFHMILLSKSYIGRTFLLKWLWLEENRVFVERRFNHQVLALTLVEELDV
jgi:hypothetical protein